MPPKHPRPQTPEERRAHAAYERKWRIARGFADDPAWINAELGPRPKPTALPKKGSTTIALRVPDDTAKRLAAAADATGVTTNQVGNAALLAGLEDFEVRDAEKILDPAARARFVARRLARKKAKAVGASNEPLNEDEQRELEDLRETSDDPEPQDGETPREELDRRRHDKQKRDGFNRASARAESEREELNQYRREARARRVKQSEGGR